MSSIIKLIKYTSFVLIAVLLLLSFMWLRPLPEVVHDAPRNLPWVLPDYRLAKTEVKILDDGRIKIEIEHLPLSDITPEMLRWFYKHLPISTVEISGKNILYTIYFIHSSMEQSRLKKLLQIVQRVWM